MFNAWDAHYRKVNVLRFTSDEAVIISGSEDSGVSIWSMSRWVVREGAVSCMLIKCFLEKGCLMPTNKTISSPLILRSRTTHFLSLTLYAEWGIFLTAEYWLRPKIIPLKWVQLITISFPAHLYSSSGISAHDHFWQPFIFLKFLFVSPGTQRSAHSSLVRPRDRSSRSTSLGIEKTNLRKQMAVVGSTIPFELKRIRNGTYLLDSRSHAWLCHLIVHYSL